jgi:exopolyphosphatase/guanosine-5'-triphosphate,3'-diphosphate pyrophosphatase
LTPLAVIDIGTNSALLLVAQRQGKDFISLHEESQTPRLGAGLAKTERIAPVSAERLICTLTHYRKISELLGAAKLIAVGTRVFRAAKNARQVIDKVTRQTGIRIRVLSAKQEAAYALGGALTGFLHIRKGVLVDIGGGSTEFVLFKQRKIVHSLSIPIGAVVLAETGLRRFRHISDRRIEQVQNDIHRHFSRLPREYYGQSGGVIAVGGTATTLAALNAELTKYNPERVHGAELTDKGIERYVQRFRAGTIADIRRSIPFDPARARVLPAGTFILAEVCKHLDIKRLRVSHRGLRWGIAQEQFTSRRKGRD